MKFKLPTLSAFLFLSFLALKIFGFLHWSWWWIVGAPLALAVASVGLQILFAISDINESLPKHDNHA